MLKVIASRGKVIFRKYRMLFTVIGLGIITRAQRAIGVAAEIHLALYF